MLAGGIFHVLYLGGSYWLKPFALLFWDWADLLLGWFDSGYQPAKVHTNLKPPTIKPKAYKANIQVKTCLDAPNIRVAKCAVHRGFAPAFAVKTGSLHLSD